MLRLLKAADDVLSGVRLTRKLGRRSVRCDRCRSLAITPMFCISASENPAARIVAALRERKVANFAGLRLFVPEAPDFVAPVAIEII